MSAVENLQFAILETLHEVGGHGPESAFYLAFQAHGLSLETFQLLMWKMRLLGLIDITNHRVTLMPKGALLLKAVQR